MLFYSFTLLLLAFSAYFILSRKTSPHPTHSQHKNTPPESSPEHFSLITLEPKFNDKKTFTLMSYNILTQKYVKRKNVKELEFDNRMASIIKEIKSVDPDIFCLQESTYDVLNKKLKPELDLVYQIVSFENEGSDLMNVIGVKRERFSVSKEIKFDLKHCDIDVQGNRGIMCVEISDKKNKEENICVINVHFPWMPVYEYEKGEIMKRVFDFILSKDYKNVIVCGDFNSIPNSLVVRMVYYEQFVNEFNGCENYKKDFEFSKKEVELMNSLRYRCKKERRKERFYKLLQSCEKVYKKYFLQSVYDQYNKNTASRYFFLRNHPEYTNFTEKFVDTIDYIFYSKNLKRIKIGNFPNIKNKDDYLPNKNFPSDHLKLVAIFQYNN